MIYMIPDIIVYHTSFDNGLYSKSVTQYTFEEELLIKGMGISALIFMDLNHQISPLKTEDMLLILKVI